MCEDMVDSPFVEGADSPDLILITILVRTYPNCATNIILLTPKNSGYLITLPYWRIHASCSVECSALMISLTYPKSKWPPGGPGMFLVSSGVRFNKTLARVN